uniref:Uncharacterized protein n=1 Tax=Oryza brachyantha TaxID=4533 RepID=J3L848_ORYBR
MAGTQLEHRPSRHQNHLEHHAGLPCNHPCHQTWACHPRSENKCSPGAVTRRARAEWARRGLGRLLEGVRHNLRWQVEVAAEVLDAIIGQVPVVVLPREGLPHVLL